jgi:hypothetical protein
MKFLFYLSLVVFFYCCCSSNQTKQTYNAKADSLLHRLTQFNDSLYSNVPDSFKKWIHVWDTVLINELRYRQGKSYYHHNVDEQNKLDSINIGIVTGFLEKYGFPEKSVAGPFAIAAILLVMQHAPVAVQEKYYPMWIEAYKSNKISGLALQLLEDRINMHRHRKQYYGTQQVNYENEESCLYPVVNPDSINAWRQEMCIGDTMHDLTIENEYKNNYKKEWDIEQYKKDLPDLIKKFKVTDSPSIRFVKQP